METTILNILLFLIIAVAGFGILAIFYMIVVEKTRDIGILKSLGASGRGVMGIFLTYGLSLGLVGSGVGLVLGLLFVHYINLIADGLGWFMGRPLFNPEIYYLYRIPTIIFPETVAWIVAGALGIAMLASVLPALVPPDCTRKENEIEIRWGRIFLGETCAVWRPCAMSEVVTQRAGTARASFVVPRHPAGGPQLLATGLKKTYRNGPVEVPVLRGVSLSVRQGEFLAVVGQSGCGKTTLLHLLGTLDVPDRGEIDFEGRRIDNLSAAERDGLRNRRFGMIFQFYHLLPELTTLENVLAPLMITHGVWSYWRQRKQFRALAADLLAMVGLGIG